MFEKIFSGGELAAEVLQKEGIKYIFGVPGGHNFPLIESCVKRGINFIGARNEANAAFMAEGWALATGKTGICTGTAGPGITNMITGMTNASIGCHPVLCIAGRPRISDFDKNELQDINQLSIIKNVTKYAKAVVQTERIPEYISNALSICMSDQPGPAYIEIPRNISENNIEYLNNNTFNTGTKSPASANSEVIKHASEMINHAQRPIIIVGGGVWWSRAFSELENFINKTKIPVFTRNASRGAISDDHPYCVGLAASASPVFQEVMARADLVILIGTRLGYTMNASSFPHSLKIIRIDIKESEIHSQLNVDLGIVSDARQCLRQLEEVVSSKTSSDWIAEIRQIKENFIAEVLPLLTTNQNPIHPMRLCFEIRQRIDENTIVIVDGGDAAMWGNLILPAKGPGQFLSISGTSFGPLGVGIPYAIASKLANPDKKVILLTGDGAFGYGLIEYDTAIRYGICFTTVIMNDRSWGIVKRLNVSKKNFPSGFSGCDLGDLKYEKFIESMGGLGIQVSRSDDLASALDEALTSNYPACINVLTDQNAGFLR